MSRVDLVFRTIGERTSDVSYERALKHIRPDNVHLIDNVRPFSRAVDQMLRIDHDCDQVVYVDADCILLEDMRPFLDENSDPYVDCYVRDRFRGRIHCGVHITRIDVVRAMAELDPPKADARYVLRPESYLRSEALHRLGFEERLRDFEILHDWFQTYRDIFRKSALRELRSRGGKRQRKRLRRWMTLWGTKEDPDFQVARHACEHTAGQVDRDAPSEEVEAYVDRLFQTADEQILALGLREKPPFDPRELAAATEAGAHLTPMGPELSHLTLICPHLGNGGVQRVVATLANVWNARGCEVTVVALYRHEVLYCLDSGVRLISLPDWRGAGLLLRSLEAWRLLHERLRSKAIALWNTWFPAGEDESRLFRALQEAWEFIEGCVNVLLGAVLRRVWFPGIWKLHLPTYLRVRGLRRAIQHAGAHNVISLCGSANVASVLACRGGTNYLVISERNDPARQKLRFPWNTLRRHYYGDADVVTANTHGAIETMRSYVSPEKLAHVPNPLDTRHPAREERVEGLRGQRLLIVGRLVPQKGHSDLFHALARLPDDLASWRLSIVGQGELEDELRTQAERLGIAGRIDWHGQVEDPYPCYEAASILVLPSLHEGSPNALIEAMSRGLPAIVSDASPGPLELVRDELNGLVFPAGDAAALASKITRLARSPDLRRKLGAEARQLSSRHALPKVLARWEELLDPWDWELKDKQDSPLSAHAPNSSSGPWVGHQAPQLDWGNEGRSKVSRQTASRTAQRVDPRRPA